MKLSVLCVTKLQPYARIFLARMENLVCLCNATHGDAQLVLAVDGDQTEAQLAKLSSEYTAKVLAVHSMGYLESVHDAAVAQCEGRYVLRLDDDETCSLAMVEWIADQKYLAAKHWSFPRVHLWGDEHTALITSQLFPDYQTRCSVREMAGGRTGVHAGSPYGMGALAPVLLHHHKFLVKSQTEREQIAKQYDSYHPGYGTGDMLPFSLPELAYHGQKVGLASIGFGGQAPYDLREVTW